ncbi:hypothetical protein BO94DRAFT_504324 [Aspergillus sclerotioniger CBS 115572]|uniref:F-box domain-containing protein n=1 Tax=Aspergillus sclerotioniger CBS 115572 TaxID=1450535 RepID=A0A317UWF9_9EURO|nr:hypothetical protein BO94DRAFT_504324 [Aspergillus sclerotioniger CBS 115572]PWY66363.1 hypothetical protein BO94DRAFT_504324 [Aspergillus sclerotioniger CBS 115572]
MHTIPTEILIRIYGDLPVPDVLHLSATCHRLRQVLDEHTPTIYKRLRRQIKCERHARAVLADQGILPLNSPSVTIRHLLQLQRNFRVVEKAIVVFDREVTANIHISNPSFNNKFYGGKPRPLHLTPTERHRFIRSYYQVWSLLLLDRPSREHRLRTTLLKDLYLIYEMCDFWEPFDDEMDFPSLDEKRSELIDQVFDYSRYLYYHIHEQDYMGISGADVELQTRGHAAIWDHCQPDFKRIVCWEWCDPDKKPVREEEVWENTTDEE